MAYQAKEVYQMDGTRVYHEMYTGKHWNDIEVRYTSY